ncbi:MAG: serine kinase [Cyanobacteria bacterium J06635_15]
MFSYFAYGLGIQSALPIPEFVPMEIKCDVTIHVENNKTLEDYLPKNLLGQSMALKLSREEAIFYFNGIGAFHILKGCKIIFIPAQEACERRVRLALVGTVMAILLYQRGLLVLHASAVEINGGAVAFLGVPGQGKSSTAAAFHAHGYDFLTDDVAAVTLSQTIATIAPGFPQMKLSPETAAALDYDFESLLKLYLDDKKRGYRPIRNFAQLPLPILRIYVLADDPEFDIEPLSPKESVMELVRHSRPTTLRISGDTPHFMQCTALAKAHTVYRLKRPRNLALLSQLVKVVEDHISCEAVHPTHVL